MTAISMGRNGGNQKQVPMKLLSYKGKRDLMVSGLLILFPILLLIVFSINIGSTMFASALVVSTFLFIRTWSRELNWVVLKRRFFDD